MTPRKTFFFRKRKYTLEEWKKNKRKTLRLSGMEYISQRGKTVSARKVKPLDCTNCKYKCTTKVNEKERNNIFETFWSINSYQWQKDFLISRIEEEQTKKYVVEEGNSDTPQRKRDVFRSYPFEVNESKKTVCKKFFLHTLNIGESYVNRAMENKRGGVFVGTDKRGRHIPHNKTSTNALEAVRNHIESFPVVDGHYTRKSSNRKYLGSDLNISQMYQRYQ